ncbi:MAG: G3E family GTPase [Akkermansiaceae bacterium]
MNFDNFSQEAQTKRHFILIGGFLGSGKTTLIGSRVSHLEKQKQKVALITNDQGEGLMDTDSARQASSRAGNVAEITGGCFCCRLEELVAAIKDLEDSGRPDVMIAEPVGSCTDLMATVLKPLEEIYKTPLTLAPLAVLLDARRSLAAVGGKPARRSFHRDIGYVYLKQVEEAEWLIVNKRDLLKDEEINELKNKLSEKYPEKKVYLVSAKTGHGLEEFFDDLLQSKSTPPESIEMDYERYAEGEAMLGWVNMQAAVTLEAEPGGWLHAVGQEIARLLNENEHEVGHFKMSLTGRGKRWRIHQVMGEDEVELIEESLAAEARGEDSGGTPELRLLVNLRAEGDAETLQGFVHQALKNGDSAEIVYQQEAAFQPGKPEPTHRVS